MSGQGIPRYQCEWCGRDVIYVRVLSKPVWHPTAFVSAIDAESVHPDHMTAKVAQVPRNLVGGRTACVVLKWGEAWPDLMPLRTYSLHKDTCPLKAKWTGHKKWVAPVRREEQENTPELDLARAIARQQERAAQKYTWASPISEPAEVMP